MPDTTQSAVAATATSFWKSTLGYFTSHLMAAAIGAGITGVLVGHLF